MPVPAAGIKSAPAGHRRPAFRLEPARTNRAPAASNGRPVQRAYRRVIRLTRSVQPHEPQRSRILYPRHYQGRQDLPPERLG
ncbi:hypothetical protein CBM2637_A200345 [Cupriavidus taiwanensis]|nr:hypothetical protein CBM2637_A200345 [Cupriavidus taiwanensis]SPA50885.1 protein of unknown function [Cupriavidus taiwanensis]